MKALFVILLIALFYLSSYRMIGENIIIGAYGAYLTFFILLGSLILFKVKKVEYNKTLTLLMFLYTLTAVTSALINSEIGLVTQSFIFLTFFLSTTLIVNSYFKNSLGKAVTITLLISQLPIIIIPLITDGVGGFPYKGIFANPNSFGMVVATIFTIFAAILFSDFEKIMFYKEKVSKTKILITLSLAIFSFGLVVISGSRTSFLAVIISIMIGLSALILFSIKHKQVLRLIKRALVGLPLFGVLFFLIYKYTPIIMYVEQVTLSKFAKKQDDLLDGRSYVWRKTIEDSRLFGNGEGYFDSMVGLGAHNTFIYILGVYGWIPLIVFSLFCVLSVLYCVRFILTSADYYKYLPLMVLLTFLALSMGENLMYKITMVTAFVLIGFASNNKRIIINS